ncbi:MAG: tetratricopeptide repeat protein [Thermomicrobiales bacterium]|nr:tetratricopeptide repeat protein [Thermomicrobiales bacterium]
MQKRSQLIVGVFAFLLACSLVASLVVPIAYEAFFNDDSGSGGDQTSIDESVENALRATAEAHPDDPGALAGLGSYLANTGRLTEAIPYYERAIGLDPDNVSYRVEFARSLHGGDLSGDAEFQFQKALELEPENPQAHFYLAELYYDADPLRVNDALDHYEATIRYGPDTFVAERAAERIAELTGTPVASPATPAG